MLIPAHVGITLGAIIVLKRALPSRLTRWSVAFWPLCLAALLPDLIDKALTLTVLRGYHTSRLFGHTLLFSALVILLIRRWRGEWGPYSWILLAHQLFDSNWTHPKTLLFPLLGFQFDRGLPTHAFRGYIEALWGKYMQAPEWFVPEILGAAILILYWYGRNRFQPIMAGPQSGEQEEHGKKYTDSVALRKAV